MWFKILLLFHRENQSTGKKIKVIKEIPTE